MAASHDPEPDLEATLVRRPAVIAPGLLDRLTAPFGDRRGAQAALTAVVAWSVTIAPAALARAAPLPARVLGLAALIAGASGPLLAVGRRRLGRHVGISLFLGLATLTWLLASPAIQPSRLDPVRAALGAIAWGLFALSWSGPRREAAAPPSDLTSPVLQARATLPPFAAPIAGVGIAVGLACLVMAWRTRESDRALLAHGVALACAVALITASAAIAIGRGKARHRGTHRLPSRAVRSLFALAIATVIGIVALVAAR